MYTGASAKVRCVVNISDTSTSAGNRNAATWAAEFFTTEIARSLCPLAASTTPVTFSTALPAIATITRPAKAFEMCKLSIAGLRAAMSQIGLVERDPGEDHVDRDQGESLERA